jgi:hypothetical protein
LGGLDDLGDLFDEEAEMRQLRESTFTRTS